MASSLSLTIFIFFLLLTVSQPHLLRTPFKPNTLFLSLHKDTATALHLTHLRKSTPRVTLPLLLDLNARFLWLTCDRNYSSATYRAPFCHSTLCSTAGVHYCHKCTASPTAVPGCHNNSCAVIATNPFTSKNSIAELAVDVVSIPSLDLGFVSGGGTLWATDPQFVFACAPPSLLQGSYPPGVRGIAALGHTPVSLPLQLASHFGFRPQFSLCLSSSAASGGGIVFGHVPQTLQPRAMAYTPLTIGAQGEYFVLIRSIKINNVSVPFNTSLFSTTRGFGGTMISTTAPYTVLERTVFTTFARSFAEQFKGATRVAAVPPFGLCFDSRNNSGAPDVLFVFQNRNTSWTVAGEDTMVRVRENVACLSFVDGGTKARVAITVGAHQLENNFVQFDLSRSRVGFIPSRLSEPSFSCSKFNFSAADQFPMEFNEKGE